MLWQCYRLCMRRIDGFQKVLWDQFVSSCGKSKCRICSLIIVKDLEEVSRKMCVFFVLVRRYIAERWTSEPDGIFINGKTLTNYLEGRVLNFKF